MFNLNEMSNAPKVFNGGNAGLVKNIEVTGVTKRRSDEPDNQPNYKLELTDEGGSILNTGFFIPKNDPNKDDEANNKRATQEISRIVHIAKAVVGEDYNFPEINSVDEAFDLLFGIIKDESEGKLFNVYVTYGSKTYPKSFLNLRYFEFFENANNTPSRLRDKEADLLVRPAADAPSTSSSTAKPENKSIKGWS